MNSPWTVIAIALGLVVVTLLAGVFKPGTLMAILIYAVVGMIFPPVAIWVGVAMILYILLAHGTLIAGNISSKVKG